MEIESAEPVRNRSDVASFSILHSERKDSQKIVWKPTQTHLWVQDGGLNCITSILLLVFTISDVFSW